MKYIRNLQNNRIQKKESKIVQFFASEMFKIYLWQYSNDFETKKPLILLNIIKNINICIKLT